jgi:phosphopantothenoylcysteine decarboxylase/phosphopantothenate--cysteine ligase
MISVVANGLSGERIVITAGGTEEPIDPIRIITNRSSGKMGFALARAALGMGASVTLISTRGDGGIDANHIPVSTVASMRQAVLRECAGAGILVMAAAVTDFRPVAPADQKIKKTTGRIRIELEPVEDFIHEVPASVFKVGFAAETQDVLANARRKFVTHGFDLVCANDVSKPGSGFGVDTNEVTLVDPEGDMTALPLAPKAEVARMILDDVARRLARRRRGSDRHEDGRRT